jgi:predicted phosphate transport protein (TIGR00153 family)
MFGKKKAKSNYYFDSFPALCHFSVQCAEYILNFMQHFDHQKLEETKVNVHLIEHEADEKKHEVTEKLLTEFMTPIDREDILQLLKLIDDITDAVEEVSLKLFLYDYKELPPDTIPFMRLTLECVQKTEECLKNFKDFEDPKLMSPLIMAVVHLEEESDTEYINDVHSLYLNETDGFRRHKGEAMYTMLEETSDRCREVCRYVQMISFKNL